jgi:hypothetical protein
VNGSSRRLSADLPTFQILKQYKNTIFDSAEPNSSEQSREHLDLDRSFESLGGSDLWSILWSPESATLRPKGGRQVNKVDEN